MNSSTLRSQLTMGTETAANEPTGIGADCTPGAGTWSRVVFRYTSAQQRQMKLEGVSILSPRG